MKFVKRVALILVLASVGAAHAATTGLQPHDVVMVCGDSITEQKRYAVFIEDYLLMCQPAPDLSVVQMGWNGETSWGFLARMENDALPFKPTVVTTCFGMNDGGYDPITTDIKEKYRTSMEGIVQTFEKNGVRWAVVGSPGAVDFDMYKKSDVKVRNQNLDALKGVASQVAEKTGSSFANVHDPMMETMTKLKAKYGHDYDVTGRVDGVHPENNGHLIMAYAFLKALGCSGDIGTITYDMKSGQADATAGHKVLSAKSGTLEIESSKYPFCFPGAPQDPSSTRGVVEFLPFNQDLNRFMLVIKNGPSAGVKVTWGKDTKQFSAAQAEAGINLSAEFLDNPFVEPFTKVEDQVRAQQDFDVIAVKSLLHSLLAWHQALPEFADSYKQQEAHVLDKAKDLRGKAQAAVVPVKHEIVITAAN